MYRMTSVRLQNLPWSKTGLVSRQVLHPLSKLQNWIWSKTGRYKTGLVSNTKIEASLRATKPKPWQSNLTSDTVEIFIQNEKAGLVPMQSRFRSRHKAGFGAAGLGTAQIKLVLEQAQSQFWSGIKTSLVSRQILHPLSQLQNWISPKKGQYKTCIVSNTKIDCVFIYIYFTYIFFIYIRIYITKRLISRKYIYTFIYTQSIFSIGY